MTTDKPSAPPGAEVTRDPVAALAPLLAKRDALGNLYVGDSTERRAKKMLRSLAEQGYFLVNAEGLAAAIDAAHIGTSFDGGWLDEGSWAETTEAAAAIFAAIQEQQP